MPYGYTAQAPDFSFVERSGRLAGQAIKEIPAAQDAKRKRELLEEQLKQIKVDKALFDKAREERIVEAAVEYQEALGLTGQDGARDRGFSLGSQFFQPMTGSEHQDPSKAVLRLQENEDRWEEFLKKQRIKAYQEETQTVQEPVKSGLAGRQMPEGQVGVEEGSMKRTTPWKSVEEMQQEELYSGPSTPSVGREATSQEAYDIARKYRVAGVPDVQQDVGVRGQQELAGKFNEGTTRGDFAGQMLEKPVVTQPVEKAMAALPAESANKDVYEKRNELRERELEFKKLQLAYQQGRHKDTLRKGYNELALKMATAIDKTRSQLSEAKKGTPQKVYDEDLGKEKTIYVQDADSEDRVDELTRLLKEQERQQADFRGAWTKITTPIERPGYTPEEPTTPRRPAGDNIPTFNSPSDPGFSELGSGEPFYIVVNGKKKKRFKK